MALPWLQILDAVIGVTDLARSRKIRKMSQTTDEQQQQLEAGGRGGGALGGLETRLAGVMVAALKEAFDRDHARLELERAQLDEERRRAEEALRQELRRQTVDRELSRLRLLGGTALVGWIASVVGFAVHSGGASVAARVVMAGGWMLLLAALATAFTAQGRVSGRVFDKNQSIEPDGVAVWLLIAGLAVTAISLLL